VVDFSKSTPQIIYLPELNNKILSGFEHIYPIDKNNIFIGGEQGFYHINYEKYKQNIAPLKVFISTVKSKSQTDKIIFGGYNQSFNNDKQTAEKIPAVAYNSNSFHFEYSSPLFEQQSNLEYSYNLKGFDKEWSEWAKKQKRIIPTCPQAIMCFR